MVTLRQAAQQALEALEWSTPNVDSSITYEEAITALRAALAKADEDRAWVEERKANWAEDKALAKRNALEEADRIRKAEEDGLCWACGHKAEVALAEPDQEDQALLEWHEEGEAILAQAGIGFRLGKWWANRPWRKHE